MKKNELNSLVIRLITEALSELATKAPESDYRRSWADPKTRHDKEEANAEKANNAAWDRKVRYGLISPQEAEALKADKAAWDRKVRYGLISPDEPYVPFANKQKARRTLDMKEPQNDPVFIQRLTKTLQNIKTYPAILLPSITPDPKTHQQVLVPNNLQKNKAEATANNILRGMAVTKTDIMDLARFLKSVEEYKPTNISVAYLSRALLHIFEIATDDLELE